MQNRTLFIGDLSIFCSEQDLYELFAKYGKVNEVRLKRDVDTQRNLSYGFVKFVTAKCAGDALKDLDGYYLHGRAMKVKWTSKTESNDHGNEPKSVQIHVSFNSKNFKVKCNVSEGTLRDLFSAYGEVVDVSIKQLVSPTHSNNSMGSGDGKQNHKNAHPPHAQSGYGFVHFANTKEGIQSARNAVDALHNVSIKDISYVCHLSHKFGNDATAENRHVGGGGGGGGGGGVSDLVIGLDAVHLTANGGGRGSGRTEDRTEDGGDKTSSEASDRDISTSGKHSQNSQEEGERKLSPVGVAQHNNNTSSNNLHSSQNNTHNEQHNNNKQFNHHQSQPSRDFQYNMSRAYNTPPQSQFYASGGGPKDQDRSQFAHQPQPHGHQIHAPHDQRQQQQYAQQQELYQQQADQQDRQYQQQQQTQYGNPQQPYVVPLNGLGNNMPLMYGGQGSYAAPQQQQQQQALQQQQQLFMGGSGSPPLYPQQQQSAGVSSPLAGSPPPTEQPQILSQSVPPAGMYYAQQQQMTQQPQYMQYPTGYPPQPYGQQQPTMYYLPQSVPGVVGVPPQQAAVNNGLPPPMYPHLTTTQSPVQQTQQQQQPQGGGGGMLRHSSRQYQLNVNTQAPAGVMATHNQQRPAQFVQYYVGASPQISPHHRVSGHHHHVASADSSHQFGGGTAGLTTQQPLQQRQQYGVQSAPLSVHSYSPQHAHIHQQSPHSHYNTSTHVITGDNNNTHNN